jgi:hypothetical protein
VLRVQARGSGHWPLWEDSKVPLLLLLLLPPPPDWGQ